MDTLYQLEYTKIQSQYYQDYDEAIYHSVCNIIPKQTLWQNRSFHTPMVNLS